jgi:hypothetical protein
MNAVTPIAEISNVTVRPTIARDALPRLSAFIGGFKALSFR